MASAFRAFAAAAALSLATLAPAWADIGPAPDAEASKGVVVMLSVVIEADGSISNATVAKSCGDPAKDWAALDHARQMKIKPITVEGVPVRAQKIIAIAIKPPSDQAAPTSQHPIKLVPSQDV